MKKTKTLTTAALIAALYVVLTHLANLLGLASGAVQIRFSEALTILPLFTAAAVPGLTVGCLLANLLTGCAFWDVVFGTLATLIGAAITYFLKKHPYLSPLPTILANMVIIPFVLILQGIGGWDMLPYFATTVGLGEIIACGVLGIVLVVYFSRHEKQRKMLFE